MDDEKHFESIPDRVWLLLYYLCQLKREALISETTLAKIPSDIGADLTSLDIRNVQACGLLKPGGGVENPGGYYQKLIITGKGIDWVAMRRARVENATSLQAPDADGGDIQADSCEDHLENEANKGEPVSNPDDFIPVSKLVELFEGASLKRIARFVDKHPKIRWYRPKAHQKRRNVHTADFIHLLKQKKDDAEELFEESYIDINWDALDRQIDES